jgi:putative MFS transporter
MSRPAHAVPGAIGLSDRMDRIPVMTRAHRGWLVVLALLLFFEYADLHSFALAAPAIREQWGLALEDVGIVTAASFFGMFFGAVLGGRLADRYGRKRVIVWAVAFYSILSLASAFAIGVVDLSIYRVLIGFGLQAMTVVVATYVAEMYPKRVRGRVLALGTAIGLLGVPAMAGFARLVVPSDPSAWRWVFVFGAGGLLVGVVALRILPESVRWTAAHRPDAAAEALVARLEEEARRRTGAELPPAVPMPVPASGSPRELIRPPLRRRMLVLVTYMIMVTVVGWGFNAWLPTLLVENGYSTAQSLTFASVISIAACPGALMATLFIDRIERRTALLLINTAIGVLLLTFALAADYAVVLVSGFLLVLMTYAGSACTHIYQPEIFPTRLRALGAGIGSGTGRLAVFGSSFVIAWALSGLGSQAVFLSLGALSFVGALVIGLGGERTRNRTLERISETPR